MFLQAEISIDPSSITKIESLKPTKAFGRILNFMQLSSPDEQAELETFTAVGILQTFNRIFRRMQITNILQLAKDKLTFYLDEQGKEDDLREALDQFAESEKNQREAHQLFETLTLVLEHHDDELRYLLQVEIDRVHVVGEHPIRIIINALPIEFTHPNETATHQTQWDQTFATQAAYDRLITWKTECFQTIVQELESSIRRYLGIDELAHQTKICILRTNDKAEKFSYSASSSLPVLFGYYGFEQYFQYAWNWLDQCIAHQIHLKDSTLVDPTGAELASINSKGMNANQLRAKPSTTDDSNVSSDLSELSPETEHSTSPDHFLESLAVTYEEPDADSPFENLIVPEPPPKPEPNLEELAQSWASNVNWTQKAKEWEKQDRENHIRYRNQYGGHCSYGCSGCGIVIDFTND